jgi:hypothetical protein
MFTQQIEAAKRMDSLARPATLAAILAAKAARAARALSGGASPPSGNPPTSHESDVIGAAMASWRAERSSAVAGAALAEEAEEPTVGVDARLAPFFSPLVITAPQGTSPVPSQPRACVPVLEHILATAMDALAELFLAHSLSKPCAWGDVSARHLEVIHTLMDDVLKGLEDATQDVSRLILKPESMEQFRRGEMLDDHCLDRMLEYLVQATGSKMVGVKGDPTCSPWVTTDSARASSYHVLGVADSLRTLGRLKTPKASVRPSDASPAGPAAFQKHADFGESWVVPGDAESPDETVLRLARAIVGSENVTLDKPLDPFGKRNILVVATWAGHTKVIRLVRREGTWDVWTHDSLGSSKWDTALQAGMNAFLLATGLKDSRSRFAYHHGESITQDTICAKGETTVQNTCGFLAFINASQLLTGQSLAQADCTSCVEAIRVFFFLWFIMLAESQGAIRKGYLAEVLNKAIQDVKLVEILDEGGNSKDAACALVHASPVLDNRVCGPPHLWYSCVEIILAC